MSEFEDRSQLLEALNMVYRKTLDALLCDKHTGELFDFKSFEEVKKLILIELFDNFIEVNPPMDLFYELNLTTKVKMAGEVKNLAVNYFVDKNTKIPFFGSLLIGKGEA